MKYLRKTKLLLTIGIVLMILTFAGCAFLNAEDPLEKLKSKTETTALNLSRTILNTSKSSLHKNVIDGIIAESIIE